MFYDPCHSFYQVFVLYIIRICQLDGQQMNNVIFGNIETVIGFIVKSLHKTYIVLFETLFSEQVILHGSFGIWVLDVYSGDDPGSFNGMLYMAPNLG